MPADKFSMEDHRWSRGTLRELVANKHVLLKAPDTSELPVPEWLVDTAGEVSALDTVEGVDVTHPDDRAALIDAYLEALQSPDTLVSCQVRIRMHHRWQYRKISWLNLIDNPDVEGLLCITEEVTGAPIDEPQPSKGGAHQATNWMIMHLDRHGTILNARGAVDQILGRPVDTIVGANALTYVHSNSLASAVDNWTQLHEHPDTTRTARQAWKHRDGSDIWLDISFLVHDEQDTELMLVDISAQIENELALSESQARSAALAKDLQLIADEVPVPVFRCDEVGKINFRNSQWQVVLGDLENSPRLHDIVYSDDHIIVDQLLVETALRPGVLLDSQVRSFCDSRIFKLKCRGIITEGRLHVVGSITDISDTVELQHLASHDLLTGLANRSMVILRLTEALVKNSRNTLVAFIDLDGFKKVNDSYGHDVGDLVLVEIAKRLTAAMRPADLVARYGGDEFVIIYSDVSASDEERIMSRLQTEVFEQEITMNGFRWQPSASIGISRPLPNEDPTSVLRRADQAMFSQKRHRRTS